MKKILIYIIGSFLLPLSSQAAIFHFTSLQAIPRDGEGLITLKLDTQGEKVNAVSGEIAIPHGITIGTIVSGQSSILLWVEPPRVSGDVIRFSGVTPGGFKGDKDIFSFVARPSVSSQLTFIVSSPEANRDDKDGTALKTSSRPFTLTPSGVPGAPVVIDDTVSPEIFTPVISSDPSLFDDGPFLSFTAQDKGSGVVRYEWASAYLFSPDEADWKPAESPLELSPGLLWQKVYVRAIDANGNSRVASTASLRHYAALWFGVILVLSVLCVLFSFARPSSYRSS